jgi:hypothetical protein
MKKRSKTKGDDELEAQLEPLNKQKAQIEREILGVEAGRKVRFPIHRTQRSQIFSHLRVN